MVNYYDRMYITQTHYTFELGSLLGTITILENIAQKDFFPSHSPNPCSVFSAEKGCARCLTSRHKKRKHHAQL